MPYFLWAFCLTFCGLFALLFVGFLPDYSFMGSLLLIFLGILLCFYGLFAILYCMICLATNKVHCGLLASGLIYVSLHDLPDFLSVRSKASCL